jgi:alcohol dehydrogenase
VVISLGGGSPHDCAKGIALVAVNGGKIQDYEGVDKSAKPQLPLVAINTTAGTASEMTRFCIITDESRHIKMAIVDKHTTPILSVNDPETMAGMPPSLTAATGMDALTHAIEAYVSTIATPITDACALKAISLIVAYLPRAVENGQDMEAREQMAYAQFLAGMAFNNASLGYVHAMAHTSWAVSTTCRTGVQCRAAAACAGVQQQGGGCASGGCRRGLGVKASADEAIAAIRQLAARWASRLA